MPGSREQTAINFLRSRGFAATPENVSRAIEALLQGQNPSTAGPIGEGRELSLDSIDFGDKVESAKRFESPQASRTPNSLVALGERPKVESFILDGLTPETSSNRGASSPRKTEQKPPLGSQEAGATSESGSFIDNILSKLENIPPVVPLVPGAKLPDQIDIDSPNRNLSNRDLIEGRDSNVQLRSSQTAIEGLGNTVPNNRDLIEGPRTQIEPPITQSFLDSLPQGQSITNVEQGRQQFINSLLDGINQGTEVTLPDGAKGIRIVSNGQELVVALDGRLLDNAGNVLGQIPPAMLTELMNSSPTFENFMRRLTRR